MPTSCFPQGKAAVRALLVQLKSSGHVLVADGYVLGEAGRKLAKFPRALKELGDLMRQVEASVGTCGPMLPEIVPNVPAKDRPVLAASTTNAKLLLTGNKTHFGPFYGRGIESAEIHSPASLPIKLEIFES